jgi:hypothetical protein
LEDDSLEEALKAEGLEITPSAMAILESLRVSPAFLTRNIRRNYPKINQVTTKVATEVATKWPQWAETAGMETAKRIPASIPSNMPSRVHKTFEFLSMYERATAKQISMRTGRAQSTERSYLNALVKGGWVTKQKAGRRAFFAVK